MNDNLNEENAPLWQAPPAPLTGKRIVVIGASGGVGEEIARALLAAGANVRATGRDGGRLKAFAERMSAAALPGVFSTSQLDALDPSIDAQLAQLAADHGPIDGVVLAVGTWGLLGQGGKPLVHLSDQEWDDLLAGNLTSMFRLLRGLIPLMNDGGVIVQINGLSADVPYPTNAVIGATSAGTKSLMMTTSVELGDLGPRLVELILGVVRTRINPENSLEGYSWLTGTQAGQHVAALLAGTSEFSDETLQYFLDRHQGPFAARAAF